MSKIGCVNYALFPISDHIYKSTLLEFYSFFLLCGKPMSNWLLIIINFYLSLMMMNQDCRNTPSPYQLSCACSDGSGNNNTRDFWGNFLVVHCQCIYKVLRDVKIYIPWKFIRIQCILPAHLLYVHNNLYIYFNLPNCRLVSQVCKWNEYCKQES